jgi:hypothetical protein
MKTIDEVLQEIRNIPEKVRTPYISNKELEKITEDLLRAREYEYNKRMEIK